MTNSPLEKLAVNIEQPSPLADIHDRVMEAYYGKLGEQFMRETQARIHWICAQIKGRRVLDVGCSQGIVPLLLAREGCQITGVDTSPQAIEEAKGYLAAEPAHVQQNVTYVNADFLSLEGVDVDPDTIVISEVLEHLVRPELFVEKATSLLKNGGRLIITVPFGVNDFIDHKHTFYLMEPFRMLSEHLQITEIQVLGKWLGIVAQKAETRSTDRIDALPVHRVRELEKAFEAIERNLRENLSAISKRLDEANKKYRSATEQIALLKPEAHKAEALAKQVQGREAELAAQQKSSSELLEAKTRISQELDEVKQRLDEANKKYRAATEQNALLKPEAQKAELLAKQLKEQDAEHASLQRTSSESLERSAAKIQALNEELESVRKQLGEINDKYHGALQQFSELQEQHGALSGQFNALNGEHSVLTEQHTALSSQHNALAVQLSTLQDQTAELQRTHDAQATTISTLLEQRSELDAELQALSAANAQGEEQRAQLQEAVAALEHARDTLEQQLLLETASREAAEATLAATQEQWQTVRQQLEQELNASRTGLGVANLKYRTVTGEQIPTLKASLSQLLERSAAQQRKIDELNENLQRANSQRHLAEQRLVKTRASLTYQLGYQIKSSATSLGGLVKLPVRLVRLYRKASNQRNRSQQKLLANQAAAPLLPPTPPLQDENYLKLPPVLASSEHSRANLLRSAEQPASALKVACIMDEFTFGSYRHECNLQALTPTHWKAELESFRPELLFIESAWRGKDDLWGSKVGHNSQELQSILAWCREHNVPTVFWNKEDPVHFETFLTTARQFDHVFTTDIDCIHRYKGALGHERVYLLPFACQPALHNPLELYQRKDAFCFAGAYYARYPERTRDLGNFVSELAKFRPLEIFDRNYGKDDANYQFPAEYQPYIVGTLPFEKIDTAYKGYRYAINLNSIKQSQSMFARRVFELLACNTLTVSNFSRGVRLLFGDLVITTDNGEEMLRRLQLLAENPLNSDKLRLAALRKVMHEHTYTQRLDYVVSKVTGTAEVRRLPQVAAIGEANDCSQLALLRGHLQRQSHDNVRLYVISDAFDASAVQDDPRIHVISRAQLKKTTIGQLVGDAPWVAGLCADDYYGPNYLLDLALATRYSRATVIGKVAHFAWDGQQAKLLGEAEAYRPAEALSARRSLISSQLVAAQPLRNWLKSLPTLRYNNPQGLAIDAFNYCENAATQVQAIADQVDDLVIDSGLTIDQLQDRAHSIAPFQVSHDAPEISGRALAELFNVTRNKFLDLDVDGDNWRVHSRLEDGKHEYVYALQDASLDQLHIEDGQLKLFLDCSPGLNLQLVVMFLDADKQRISHVMQHANRNQISAVPPEAAYVRLGLRAYASGSAEIKALVLGHRDLQPSEMIGQADHLVLTNHYPAYADQYRNKFVHSRVMAYQQQGTGVDVFRLRSNESVSYQEFQNVDVVTGCSATLTKMLEKNQYKAILVHFLDEAMWNVIRSQLDSTRIVVWVHGSEIQPWWRREYNFTTPEQLQLGKLASEKRMNFWRGLLLPMHKNLKLVFVSRYFAEEVMEDLGFRLPDDQYAIIHNPINTELFSFIEKAPEQRNKVLSIRPFTSKTYANDLTVKAIELLAQKPWFKEMTFRIVGDGPMFDEVLAPLRAYPNVEIQRGFLNHDEIADLHKQHGVFLCPSRMDTQGVSRDEAMASGLVPVTTGVAAIPEFVDQNSGFAVEPESAEQLAEALERLHRDTALFSTLSCNAAQRVRDQSDWQKMAVLELNTFRDI